jgi:hypothetical protein
MTDLNVTDNITYNDTFPYRQHLRGLLCDIVGEYLASEEVSADDMINDFRAEIKSWMDYHQQNEMKASEMYCKSVGLANSKL